MGAERLKPTGRTASLFVTCMVDMIYPDTGWSVVEIMEHLGWEVDFPEGQTCCGQPAFNSGYRQPAREVAIEFLRAFQYANVIVTPSGSCAAMVRHEYPILFSEDDEWRETAERLSSITWELTEFIVDGLGISDIGGSLSQPQTVSFHDACHGLRLLGLGRQSRVLVDGISNAAVQELEESKVCCGFGGLFSVKMGAVSASMMDGKVQCIEANSADTVLTGDVSCMTQMNGGLSRLGSTKRVRHVADFLAEAIREDSRLEGQPVD